MVTKIESGDYCINSHGTLVVGNEIDSILQRAQILLKMKKGSFILNKHLGSELHTLDVHSCTIAMLKVIISEALASIRDLEVCDVERNIDKKDDALSLTIYLRVAEKEMILEV